MCFRGTGYLLVYFQGLGYGTYCVEYFQGYGILRKFNYEKICQFSS